MHLYCIFLLYFYILLFIFLFFSGNKIYKIVPWISRELSVFVSFDVCTTEVSIVDVILS